MAVYTNRTVEVVMVDPNGKDISWNVKVNPTPEMGTANAELLKNNFSGIVANLTNNTFKALYVTQTADIDEFI